MKMTSIEIISFIMLIGLLFRAGERILDATYSAVASIIKVLKRPYVPPKRTGGYQIRGSYEDLPDLVPPPPEPKPKKAI